MGSVPALRMVMQIQMVVTFAYGASFLLIPDFTLGTLFEYDVETFWPRAVGVPLLGLAWLEWNVTQRLEERLDLVWPFALVPGLFVVALLWELAADTYPGSESFWWVSLGVTFVFFVAVLAARPSGAPKATASDSM